MKRRPSIQLIPLVLAVLVMASCGVVSPHGTTLASASDGWADGIEIGRARQFGAPAIGLVQDDWVSAWTDGPDLYFRRLMRNGMAEDPRKIVAGITPWEPRLIPGLAGTWHLLWHDTDRFGDRHLIGAHLSSDGTLLRGPITISNEPIGDIAAMQGANGDVVVVWTDAAPRSSLYGQQIDSQGRPVGGSHVEIVRNVEKPALARTDDGMWVLSWLALPDTPHGVSSSRTVKVVVSPASIPWDTEASALDVGIIHLPAATTFIENVEIGLDRTHAYIFISYHDTVSNTSATEVRAVTLEQTSDTTSTVSFQVQFPEHPSRTNPEQTTGFVNGPVRSIVDEGSLPAAWPMPAAGQHDTLPVAFNVEGRIMIGYFREGQFIGYQPITQNAGSLGRLGLVADSEHRLTAIWSYYQGNSLDATMILSTSQH